MWDTLPTAGCELPCPPQLKCLDNIYCKFFSSTYIHLFIQTHFWHLSTRGLPTLQVSHTAPSSWKDPDGSKRDYWTASLSIQRSPINTDTTALTNTVQEHRVYLKRPSQDLFSCATQNYKHIIVSLMWECTHWAPGSQALHMLKEETFILLITTNEFIPSVSELSQAHWG